MTMTLTSVEDTSAGLRSLEETAGGDLLHGFQKRELWGRLGWLDVKRRYRRTTIGPFWNSITLAIYVLAVGTVGAAIWHQNIYDYLPYLVSGMVVWTLVSSIIRQIVQPVHFRSCAVPQYPVRLFGSRLRAGLAKLPYPSP